jgi:NAD(P)-dependent dehydrogenase (short-subunit alcohol dehydrogenase family)
VADGIGTMIVTGGGSGLGRAVAAAVRAAGGTSAILDRVPVAEFAHEVVDLADTRAAEAATARLAERLGRVDAVFTAAGIDRPGPLDEVPGTDWDRVLAVNLLGTAAVVRAALPHLKRSGGTVVTVASTLGLKAVGDATAYCASKFGIVGFTRALAAELRGQVGVTLLIPGGMSTAFFDEREEKYKPPPDAKLARPEDVAQTVLFALRQPPGLEVRELVVAPSEEGSWP